MSVNTRLCHLPFLPCFVLSLAHFERIPLKKLGLILTFCCFISIPVTACTIFVLTDGTRALFFNNEDWLNPNTRIWLAPAGDGHYGCAYVGFDDGRAQGGLNTEGLAFDWVAGYMEKWEPDPGMKRVRGNPSERMLEDLCHRRRCHRLLSNASRA